MLVFITTVDLLSPLASVVKSNGPADAGGGTEAAEESVVGGTAAVGAVAEDDAAEEPAGEVFGAGVSAGFVHPAGGSTARQSREIAISFVSFIDRAPLI